MASSSSFSLSSSSSSSSSSSLPLANKLASLLAALVVRDFPQRWTTCIQDLFSQLWTTANDSTSSSSSTTITTTMGNKMCLQVLQLVAEDCTDSDFNSKVRVCKFVRCDGPCCLFLCFGLCCYVSSVLTIALTAYYCNPSISLI
jgi:hypothetical protein